MPNSPSLTLVLPGALPPSPIAPELAKQLAAAASPAPTLLRWLERASAKQAVFDVDQAGCSALESWFIARAGFEPADGALKPGSALAPLLAGSTPSQAGQPVWVAELVHIQIGRDGLVMTDPSDLGISDADGTALLASVRELFDADGFGVEAIAAQRWRISPPGSVRPYAATPSVVVGSNLDDWWPRGLDARPWRRLVNEIQMSWHEHPVNQQRESAAQVAINGLWLHGGAPDWQPRWNGQAPSAIVADAPWLQALALRSGAASLPGNTAAKAVPGGAIVVVDGLEFPNRSESWGDWFDALKRIERDWIAPLDDALASGRLSAIDVVLPDARRIVTLHLGRRPALLRWLPHPKQDWKHWWHLPES